MAEEKQSASTKSEPSAPAPASAASASSTGGQNGKGDVPRNCFSEQYRSNFDSIDWSK